MRPLFSIRNTICCLFAFSAIGLSSAIEVKEAEIDEDYDESATQSGWPAAEFASPEKRGRAFAPEETFKFRTQWGFFRKAGSMSIQTENALSEEGDPVLSVTTHTESHGLINQLYPIDLNTVAILDTNRWRLLWNRMEGREGKRQRDMKSVFDYEEGVMVHVDEHYPDRNATRTLPYEVPLDDSSALLQVRGWDMTIGNRYPLLVSSKGKLYYIEMQIKERETLRTTFGKREAFRIEPVSAYPLGKLFREGGHFTIWISADPQRIPLRFDVKTNIGIASMILESYEINDEAMIARRDESQ